jgi:hypothetical protein
MSAKADCEVLRLQHAQGENLSACCEWARSFLQA